MKKEAKQAELEAIKKRIEEARVELRLAEQDENYAIPEFLDIAIDRVSVAKANLNSLYRLAKLI